MSSISPLHCAQTAEDIDTISFALKFGLHHKHQSYVACCPNCAPK